MTERPTKPTLAQVKEITQPESVTGRAMAEHWAGTLYLRKLSPYLTKQVIKTSITANGVTWIMIVSGFSAGLTILIPGQFGVFLPMLMAQMQMLWDCVDGEVARWRETFSPLGAFLDRVGHYLAESSIPIALGLRVGGWPEQPITNSIYPFMGAFLATLVVFNKGMNDAVHVSRAMSGLPKLSDTKGMNLSNKSLLRTARKIVSFFPFHRVMHSIEMTLFIAILGVAELITNNHELLKFGLIAVFVTALFSTPLHVAAIVTSNKLKA
jgi:phosphatidylglycerophosphate synthase